ncbi:hypothetical protein GCM10008905_31750 [Clostridium malenominatum]|uniref:Uncharacterized protein n=1 Tax=Clostridium malenominatum TaxID=1539 RepID=A0ABN1J6S8_9CLOT
MKNKLYIAYILGTIIGFLMFAFSINYVESKSLLIIVGIVGMSVMMYCIAKVFNFQNHKS